MPNPTLSPPAPSELITVRDVAAMLKFCPRQIWKMAAMGALPGPIRLTPRAPRWRRSDIVDYIDALAARRTR